MTGVLPGLPMKKGYCSGKKFPFTGLSLLTIPQFSQTRKINWTEDHQKQLYKKQTEVFKKCPYIAGISPWILYDFRCPRRLNRYQEGFNRKGLIDAERKKRKAAFYVMQEFYAEIKKYSGVVTKLLSNSTVINISI